MSAISQSVQFIQAAIKTHPKFISLLCREITLNHNAGIFTTMTPATKGYGGRQKLSGNLKQLFRPVAMSVPNNELIAKVMMLAEGFKSAKVMAQRIVALFLLSRQLLSVQPHYKWGLRSLKPILSLAGRLLQDYKRNHGQPSDDVEEAILLIKAVRMNTMSKLTFADARRFQSCSLPGLRRPFRGVRRTWSFRILRRPPSRCRSTWRPPAFSTLLGAQLHGTPAQRYSAQAANPKVAPVLFDHHWLKRAHLPP